MRSRTHTQSSADLREEQAAEQVPDSSAWLQITGLEHQGWLTEAECEHRDAPVEIQQHREILSLLGERLRVAAGRREQLSLY